MASRGRGRAGDEGRTPPRKGDAAPDSTPSRSGPRLIRRRGVVYLAGGPVTVPVWRLEMARRAGSSPAALADAFPGITPEGLDLAFAYARRHAEAVDRLIQARGPAEPAADAVPVVDEDDGEGFERELGALLDRDAELYRRLAR